MFERLFLLAMQFAARLLFAASIVMLLWGVGFSIHELTQARGESFRGFGGDRWGMFDTLFIIFTNAFGSAATLFFGSAVIHLLEVGVKQLKES